MKNEIYKSIIASPVLHRIVDKTHINIDGVDVWNTILDPDWHLVQFSVDQCLHGGLGLLGGVELHQAPVLEDTVFLGDLR